MLNYDVVYESCVCVWIINIIIYDYLCFQASCSLLFLHIQVIVMVQSCDKRTTTAPRFTWTANRHRQGPIKGASEISKSLPKSEERQDDTSLNARREMISEFKLGQQKTAKARLTVAAEDKSFHPGGGGACSNRPLSSRES